MKAEAMLTRRYRERLLADPYRPAYHFAIPDDLGIPGDSNGAFYADGIYHLMYLYKNCETEAFHWGHLSSIDLLHWRNHPDALTQFEAFVFLQNLASYGYIEEKTHKLIRAAVSDNTLSAAPVEIRDYVRAAITKSMIMAD